MNRPHPPAPSPLLGEGGQDLAFKVPLPLWERDLGRGNDIRARGLLTSINTTINKTIETWKTISLLFSTIDTDCTSRLEGGQAYQDG